MPNFDRFDVFHLSSQDQGHNNWGFGRGSGRVDFSRPGTPAQYPPDLELEPIHLEIDLHIDVANLSVAGVVTTTVKARHSGPTSISLDGVDFIDVEVQDPDGRELKSHYNGRKINITWPEPFEAGEERRAAVNYRVIDPVDGLFFSRPDQAYPNRPWYAATDHETERARHWLPSLDLPNVRTTLDFHLRAEERFTILANGYLLAEENHGDGTKTAHWRLDQLCPSYLICFAVGDFIRADDGFFDNGENKVELAYFTSQDYDEATLLRSFGRTGAMMKWMTGRLAMPFPFPKYYQFSLPLMGGAMENISLVSWGNWALLDEATAEEVGYGIDEVNVHEMAHSFFGDAVVIRDFAHAWLKESWATYMEQCWNDETKGQDAALHMYYENAKAYFNEADERYRRPIVTRRFKSSWKMYDRHLYPGGACRLHTLRNELGDDVFWPAVSDYLFRFEGKVVETDDFRHVMEEHSGRSLGRFFDQWFHSPGYPDIKVTFKYDEKEEMGFFQIKQAQVNKDKGNTPFVLSTELGWTIDGQEHRQPVKLEMETHTFMVPMPSKPQQVRFDPGNMVLHKLDFNPGEPMLRRQLVDAPDVVGRILAARELAKSGKRANIEAIVDAYKTESFWGVRREFALALAEANSEAAVAGLAKLIKSETDPKVLPRLFEAAAKVRDTRIRDAIGDRLKGDLGPIARRAAFMAMGAQREKADWETLLEGSKTTGYQGLAQSGAFAGLAATRRKEAVDVLLEQVGYGVLSDDVRPAIATALADIGRGLEKATKERVLETLSDLLRDPWLWMRRRSALALVQLRDPKALPALEAFSRTLSAQMQTIIEEAMESLRSEDKSDGSAVKKQVETLNEKVRKLEDQLQKLEARLKASSEEKETSP